MKKVISKKDLNNDVEVELLLEAGMSWSDKIKSLLPDFRYNVGGKNALNPFNRAAIKKIDADRKAKIETIINVASNDVLKRMDAHIKSIAPNFPNDPDSKNFVTAVEHIAHVYEAIVNATKTNPPQLDVDTANKIIDGLSEYVKYYDEVKLAAKYSVVNEGVDEGDIELGEEPEMIDELFDSNAKDVRSRFRSRTPQGAARKPETTKTKQLKSLTLPILLTGLGGSLKGFEWLVNSPWFIDLFKEIVENPTIETIRKVVREVGNEFTTIRPGEGLTQILNRFVDAGIDINSSGPEIVEGIAKLGGGDVQKGIDLLCTDEGIFTRPDDARMVLEKLAANPTGYGPDAQTIFKGTWAGTGAEAGDLLVCKAGGILGKIVYTTLIKVVPIVVLKKTVTYGAGLAAAQGLGAVVAPLGIAMVAAGALVFLARRKGLKDSRHATLDTLYQMIQPVQPTANNSSITKALPPGPTPPKQLGQGDEPQGQKQIAGRAAPKQIGGGSQRQIGTGEPEVKITGGGGRPERKIDTSKLDAQDIEAEPVEPQGEPRQLGAGETKPKEPVEPRQLGAGEATSSSAIKDNLVNFFKDVLRLKPKQRRRNIQEAKFSQLNNLKDDTNRVEIDNFSKSIELLNALALEINRGMRNKNKLNDDKLASLLTPVYNNPVHREIVNIKVLIKDNINNKDLLMRFIKAYMDTIKVTPFRNISTYDDLQGDKQPLDEVTLRGEKFIAKFLENFKINFRKYLTSLFRVFEYLAKEQQQTSTEEQPLQEAKKKKKNKYSKKASEFIGKEISHLKKDKGYPQDRAVAAAINVAKEKGMKVGAKKKKSKA
jgi:hypothetical protein